MTLRLIRTGLPDAVLTDRVNPVPAGGKIRFDGKRPIAINLENKTVNTVIFGILKVMQEPLIDETIEIQPKSSVSFFIDRTTTVADYQFTLTNRSETDTLWITTIEDCIRK